MSGRFRAIAVVIALVLVVFVVYRGHQRSTNRLGPQPPVMVLVAAKPIQKGTAGDVIRTTTGWYKPEVIPRDRLQSGAIADPSVLRRKVAVRDIPAGEQLTVPDFGPSVSVVPWPPMLRTITIARPTEIGGQITVGGHVDVWVAIGGKLRQLGRNMYILGIDAAGGTVTLSARPTQARKLVYATQHTNSRLILRVRHR